MDRKGIANFVAIESMKNQFVKDIVSGRTKTISDVFAVRVKKPPVPYRNKKGTWFELRVADKTGEIAAKYWGSEDGEATKLLYDAIPLDCIVHINGFVEPYKEMLQVAIKDKTGLRLCAKDEYDMTDFIATSNKDISEMFNELTRTINSIKNEQLKALLKSFFDNAKFAHEFRKTPAAMTYHQNWAGGLLEHVLNIIAICETIARVHPDLDRDLLVTGAILHDIGKVREFEMSTTIKVSKEGQLIGHIVIGYEMVKEKMSAEFDENLRHKVLHMILSHQGKLEFASPKEPMIPEAVALHYADEIDSKTAYIIAAKKSANTESAWIWDKRLGRSIYLE